MYDCLGWVKIRHTIFGLRKTWDMRLLGTTLWLHEPCGQEIAMEYSVMSCKVVNHLLPWRFTLKLSSGEKLRVSCGSTGEAREWKEALQRASNQVFSEEYKLLEAVEETKECTIFNAVNILDESKVRVQRMNRDLVNAFNLCTVLALCRQLYAVRNVAHPKLLCATCVFHEADYAYIVTKRVKGKRLSQVVTENGGKFSEQMTRHIVYQLLEAISYMHLKGFVLRKVTLDNIWCNTFDPLNPKVLLADFANVSFVDDEEDLRMTSEVGDNKYHAPEILNREQYNASVDMFALGVCVYRMLSGSFPFNSDMHRRSEMVEERERILGFREDAWKSISEDGKSFVKFLLKPIWFSRTTAVDAEDDIWFYVNLSESEESAASNAESFTREEVMEAVDNLMSKRVESTLLIRDNPALLQKDQAVSSAPMIRLLSPLSEETPPLSSRSALDTCASVLKRENVAEGKGLTVG
ncbi:Protein kinase-like domain [Gracilaria domingensis]|nr:Protein kinase-like domain [Gracilaria domingensis]